TVVLITVEEQVHGEQLFEEIVEFLWSEIVMRQPRFTTIEDVPSSSTAKIEDRLSTVLAEEIGQMSNVVKGMREDNALTGVDGIPDCRIVLHQTLLSVQLSCTHQNATCMDSMTSKLWIGRIHHAALSGFNPHTRPRCYSS
ncbi:MAG: hypothetical protein ACXVAV_14525, partial [Ktedonobacteraceae bacterium]